jgi:uncharacterized protein YqgC (DUF456 family)
MPPEFQATLLVFFDFIVLGLIGLCLVGLIIPVFPGLTAMWIIMLIYDLSKNIAGQMTGWDWFLFGVITVLMISGNIIDNLIIAYKMRDRFIPWSSIIWAFAAGLVASLFFTPIVGLVAAPVGLFLAEISRLKDREQAIESTKAYMIGWGWAFGARFLIGLVMTGLWMLSAWVA